MCLAIGQAFAPGPHRALKGAAVQPLTMFDEAVPLGWSPCHDWHGVCPIAFGPPLPPQDWGAEVPRGASSGRAHSASPVLENLPCACPLRKVPAVDNATLARFLGKCQCGA